MLLDRSELPLKFGSVEDVAIDQSFMSYCPVPPALQMFLTFKGRSVAKVYCNDEMKAPLFRAFQNIVGRGLKQEVKEFGGCFNIRKSRSDDRWSVHSWGMAIDINPTENPLGSPGKLSPGLVMCFTDEGFIWGGSWKVPDPMHFQYCTND